MKVQWAARQVAIFFTDEQAKEFLEWMKAYAIKRDSLPAKVKQGLEVCMNGRSLGEPPHGR